MIILENVLTEKVSNEIESYLTGGFFPWYFGRDISDYKTDNLNFRGVFIDKNTINTPQMTHDIFDANREENPICSPHFYMCQNVLDSVCEKMGKKQIQLVNAKFNLLFNNSEFEEGKYNTPHIDISCTNNNYTILYYVNDSDGDTIIFNETEKDNFTDLTIKHKIKPKKNQAAIFESCYFHTSSNPRLYEKRIVMNINVVF
jgi:hypothetical protein